VAEAQMKLYQKESKMKQKKMSYFDFRPSTLSNECLNKNSSISSYSDLQEEFIRMKKELAKVHQ